MEYYIIISASIIIILSYLFGRISDRTNIPSVLLLIIGGIMARESLIFAGSNPSGILTVINDIRLIELLGTLGLIMIVLEAALDLKLSREKLPILLKALFSSITVLLASAFGIATIIYLMIPGFTFIQGLIYATPLSILSSAIVIPSVARLSESRREFHIYDSTLSDIIGIMLFYFLIELAKPTSNAVAVGDFFAGLVLTIFISVIFSYLLVYIFHNMKTKTKLFLMISVLLLLYSVGKLMHLSSLIIILIFGLILSNPKLFFSGPLKRFMDKNVLTQFHETFHMITMESAFVVRTFFFFIFGFSVSIASLFDFRAAVISAIILLTIYILRGLILSLVLKISELRLATLIAPRGLITLLLFYSIPSELANESFKGSILLFVIILTSILMTIGLIKNANQSSTIQE
jgi:cell volume regulation protein A